MTAEGWYPDPSGAPQERWWDGGAWTGATRPYSAPPQVQAYAVIPVVPVTQVAAPAPKLDADTAGRRGFVLGIVSAAFMAVAVAFGVIGMRLVEARWVLGLAILIPVPAATILGILGIVFSSIALRRHTADDDKTRAQIGLLLSIMGAATLILVLVVGRLTYLAAGGQ